MVECIKQFANDMMASLELNALVGRDLYADDAPALVRQLRETRESSIRDMGISEQDLIEMGAIPATLAVPINICGIVSNTLCSLFLDKDKFGYRFNCENRAKEGGYHSSLMTLTAALDKRDPHRSYVWRVNCKTHSYMLYLPGGDTAYLMQGNAAPCMKTFTLQEWMNGAKSAVALSVRAHVELLSRINGQKAVVLGPDKRALVDTFSIDDDHATNYPSFDATGLVSILRGFDEEQARANLIALYKRAGIAKPPAWAK